MSYLLLGAGNAGEPVAGLLNHLGYNVIIIYLKEISAFKKDVQRIFLQMKNEGIENGRVLTNEDFSKVINDLIPVWKLVPERMSQTFITNCSCFDMANTQRNNVLYYTLDEDINFKCSVGDESLMVGDEDNNFSVLSYMRGYFFENSVTSRAVALSYGLKKSDGTDALTVFEGLSAHMGDVGDYKVIFDSAFLYDGIKITIDYFKDGSRKNHEWA